MEAKDTPTVQLLDRASPPEKKSTPKRTRIVVLVSTLCLILGIVAVFVLESFENTKKFPERYKQWLDIGEKIRSDFRSAKTFIRRTLRIKKKI
jgi:capsular polysaccharide biosynthesis protein